MIIYIHGPDTFRSRQYLKEQVEKFKIARDPQGYNVVFTDATHDEPGKILGEISSAPFLADKRMIVVENILACKDKDFMGTLIEMVKNNKVPESNIVLFWQGEDKSKIKEVDELEKLLKKEKYAKEFEMLAGAQLSVWIKQEFVKSKSAVSMPALNFLAQNAGGDMWRLSSLIAQLSAYVGTSFQCHPELVSGSPDSDEMLKQVQHDKKTTGREVGVEDVKLFLDEKVDDNVFNMVEAVVSGNRKQAYKLLTEQRRLGEEDGKLFGLILWQFRILVNLRSLFETEDNLTADQMAKQLGLHPFVVKKNLALVKRMSSARLKEIYEMLLDIDKKIKTGRGDLGLLVDVLVGRL